MDPTALSVAARELRAYLASQLSLALDQVLICHPGAAAREQETSNNGRDLLSVFMYRVEHGAYPADGSNDDPFYVRAFCLLTAFCLPDSGGTGLSAGEKDLRLIGGALAALHKQPFLRLRDGSGQELAALQVVMSPLAVEDINHIWATQGELPYRLSVSYELALLPAPLAKAVARAPKVASLALSAEVQAAHAEPQSLGFIVPPVRVPTADPAWEPALRFVGSQGGLRQALDFVEGSVPTTLDVVGAGRPGAQVQLAWERWRSATGWQPLATAPQTLTLETDVLDSASRFAGSVTAVPIPDFGRGQLQLTAAREVTRGDGATLSLRSNPLLISIHGSSP